jgi:hypothetical protein
MEEKLEYSTAEMNSIVKQAYLAGREGSALIVDSRSGDKTVEVNNA